MKTITEPGIFERKPKWKNYRHLTTSDRESAKYRQVYPSAPSARASNRLTSSQDLDRSFEVPAPVLEKEPSVFLPAGDYEIRRSLMRVRELFTIYFLGGEVVEERLLSHAFDIEAMADEILDRSI